MIESSAFTDVVHEFHIANFNDDNMPVAGRHCIGADSIRHMTAAQLFSELSTHSDGPKQGSAVIFAHFDCRDDGRARRANEYVTGAPALMALDSDSLNVAQRLQLQALLKAFKWNWLIYSSHSQGRADKPEERFRLVLQLNRPRLTAKEAQLCQRGVVLWLADHMDLRADQLFDKACKDPCRLYYLNRCDPKRRQQAYVHQGVGGVLVDVDKMIAYAGVSDYSVPVADRSVGDWDVRVKTAAEEDLARFLYSVQTAAGNSLRTEIVSPKVALIGGYVALGLVGRAQVLEGFHRALTMRAAAFPGQDDHTVGERLKDFDTFLRWGEGLPDKRLPQGFTPQGVPEAGPKARKLTGLMELVADLKGKLQPELYSLEQGAQRIKNILGIPQGIMPMTHVVKITTSAGKTYAAIEHAINRASQGLFTVIAAPDHGLLIQTARDIRRMGGSCFHYYGAQVEQARTDGEECIRMAQKDPVVLNVIQAGGSLVRSVCGTCPHTKECEAKTNGSRDPRKSGERIILVPYAAVGQLMDWDLPGDTQYIFDENFAAPKQVTLKLPQLRLILEQTAVWAQLDANLAQGLQNFICKLLDNAEPERELLTSLARYRCRLAIKNCNEYQLKKFVKEREQLVQLLECAWVWLLDENKIRSQGEDELQFDVISEAQHFLRENSVWLLSATPNPELYKDVPHELHEVDVHDWNITARVLVKLAQSSRRSLWRSDGSFNEEKLARDLKLAFRACPTSGKLYLCTYKFVSDMLNGPYKHMLLGRDVEVSYYEIAAGSNRWRDCEGFITLYDPRTPPRQLVTGDYSWDISKRDARSKLTQAHGRARDCQPRKAPAWHVHVGSVVPEDWGEYNATLLTVARGPSEAEPLEDGVRAELLKWQSKLGQTALAEKMRTTPRTLRRWLTSENGPGADGLKKIGDFLDSVDAPEPASVSSSHDSEQPKEEQPAAGVRGALRRPSGHGGGHEKAGSRSPEAEPRSGPIAGVPGRQPVLWGRAGPGAEC